MVRLAFLVLAFSASGLSAFSQGTLAGRNLSVTIVNREDLSVAPWQGASVSLVSMRAVIKSDETVYSLLQANGIYPDSEAFTLLYDLNPGLRDLKELKEGRSLELPRVATEDTLARLKGAGNLARVVVDPDLHRALIQSTKELQGLIQASAGVTRPGSQDQLKSIAGWYAQIDKRYQRRTGPPLRRETLHQLSDEAAALNSMLQAATRTNQPLSADDAEQIAAIYDDLTKIMANYGQSLGTNTPKGEDSCDVVVRIIGGDPSEGGAIRVYYTFNGLYRNPPSDPPVRSSGWTQLGSGHSQKLLNDKNYKLWAARDGAPGHPLTELYRLETACGEGQIPVELSVAAKVK